MLLCANCPNYYEKHGKWRCGAFDRTIYQLSIRRISQLMGMKNISIKLWVDNQDTINIEKNQGEK